MASHLRNAHDLHARVFLGDEAREQLIKHKRDSHGDAIKFNVPEGFDVNAKAIATESVDALTTAVSVVYVTLPQTFSGQAVYSTISNSPSATAPAVSAAQVTDSSNSGSGSSSAILVGGGASTGASIVAGAPVQATRSSSAGAFASATGASASPSAFGSSSNSASGISSGSSSASSNGGSSDSSSSYASTTTTSADAQSGMSGGAKAGLAFGILLGLALVGGLLFFCWRRKKNPKDREEIMDEKHTSFVDAKARHVESRNRGSVQSVPASVRSVRTASTAPRLSLRPVTQFLPNLSGEPARGNGNLDVRQQQQGGNPFNDSAAVSEKQARAASPQNPFESHDDRSVAAGQGSAKHTPKTSWSGSEPSTPHNAKFGTAAVVPVAAGAPQNGAPRGPNNVHRVQLDFKPSMEDELELRSGQLVRMLHEYDDGWALCIRMDRSQQGVAPRTCLSKLPVKPRPQGPPQQGGPNGPNSRPGTAQSNRGPPQNFQQGFQPPNPNAMYPRPLTPTQSGRDRSESVSNAEGSTSPNSMPSRKPVPGQAM